MPPSKLTTAVLAASVLAGLPWLHSAAAAPRGQAGAAAAVAPNRVVVLAATSDAYQALAIPKTYKSDVEASLRLLIFRDGLCVRDRGIVREHTTRDPGQRGAVIMEEEGVTESASVAADGREAIVISTKYVSRVDITPGTTSVDGDTVTSVTTLTLVNPAHPDGAWQLTLEGGRWVGDVIVLPSSMGLAVTSFVPRRGPFDLRILDISGRERVRVPESSGAAVRVEAAPEGGFVVAEMAFAEGPGLWDRGLTVFDVAKGTQWTYGWRYGSDDEPLSWTVAGKGILSVKLAGGMRRFDPTGRKL